MTDAERPPGTWRFGRLAGTDLLVRPSLLIMAGLLVLVFAGQVNQEQGNPWAFAVALVLGLYVSVVVHEFAHVIVARGFGMSVRSVTLHLLGGETTIEGESRSAGQEFWTAVVGPLMSAVLGFAFVWSSGLFPGAVADIVWHLGAINITLAIFNLIPAWPMDGGRVLKAAAWMVSRRESIGSLVAGWIGRFAAVGIAGLGLFSAVQGGVGAGVDLTLSLLIGWFVWAGSGAAIQHGRWLARVERLRATELSVAGDPTGLPTLPADITGDRLLRTLAANPAGSYALVDDAGQPRGVLHAEDVAEAYRAGRR